MTSEAFNTDCMEYMKTLPDKYFDLVVADPPYGDGRSQVVQVERERWSRFGGRFDRYKEASPLPRWGQMEQVHRPHNGGGENSNPDGRNLGGEVRKKIIAWDVAPEKEVFDEIFRVSRNQIIWGGNYFTMPPTRCFLVWRKLTISENFSMAMAEYAWTSFDANAKVFEAAPQGKKDDPRFHPTQKPVELYDWIFGLFSKPGQKVFDPFLGSGSSRISAFNAGLDFVGCEIDPVYFQRQEERFAVRAAQTSIFDMGGMP